MSLISETVNGWLDKYELVKPQKEWQDSGNGICYSTVLIAMADALGEDVRGIQKHFFFRLSKCEFKPGVYKRNPQGSFGQNSHDDYLGIAVACLIENTDEGVRVAKSILWRGLTSFWFFNNTDKFLWSACLIRFPHVWLVMWVAAFPWLKYPLYPAIALVGMFMDWKKADESGTQLQWIYFYACKKMGFKFQKYDEITAILPLAFSRYYAAGMPFTQAAKELKARNG